jgi:malic enzyme
MFIAAAHALAASVQQPSVESIIPSMFDQAARDAVYHSIVPKQ